MQWNGDTTVFALIGFDKPDSVPLRMATWEAHLAFVRSRRSEVKFAAPFLNDAGEMIGTLLLVDLADRLAAEAFQAEDPYTRADLFERREMKICPPNYEFVDL
ncbi:YciI family protein [Sphingomonas sp. CL5.1]|nr:YciI family protein [Sphingomonas sp. CL5.1]